MKKVLLSADNSICLYSVPDKVADNLEAYCMEFCMNWLRSSPDAVKYRVKRGDTVCFRYNEEDFIDYLNRYICSERSIRIGCVSDTFEAEELPEKYAGLPYFNF